MSIWWIYGDFNLELVDTRDIRTQSDRAQFVPSPPMPCPLVLVTFGHNPIVPNPPVPSPCLVPCLCPIRAESVPSPPMPSLPVSCPFPEPSPPMPNPPMPSLPVSCPFPGPSPPMPNPPMPWPARPCSCSCSVPTRAQD